MPRSPNVRDSLSSVVNRGHCYWAGYQTYVIHKTIRFEHQTNLKLDITPNYDTELVPRAVICAKISPTYGRN